MPRAADPGVAARLTTGVSREEREALERIARDMRVELATVVRWAVIDYLAREAQKGTANGLLPEQVAVQILEDPRRGHWLWQGTPNAQGYGRVYIDGRTQLAHRYVYEQLVGPIPAGMYIDHTCRIRECVAPDHLRVVTPAQNAMENSVSFMARRGASDHCERGHLYDERNLIVTKAGARLCRMCRNAYMRALMAQRRLGPARKNPHGVPRKEAWRLGEAG